MPHSFTNPDLPSRPENFPGLRALHEVYGFPDRFFTERLNNTTYSFGTRMDGDYRFQFVWAHFLLRDVSEDDGGSAGSDDDEGGSQHSSDDASSSGPRNGENITWMRMAYILRWDTTTAPPHSTAASIDATAGLNCPHGTRDNPVTLLFFNAPASLKERLITIASGDEQSFRRILNNPFLLLTHVYESLYLKVDEVVWKARDEVVRLERHIDREAEPTAIEEGVSAVQLSRLYRLTQAVIYLREGAKAASLAAERVVGHYRTLGFLHPSQDANVLADLEHTADSLRATSLRLESLSARLGNIDRISYSLASLRDSKAGLRLSHVLRHDSARMALVSAIALLFLPTSSIASVVDAVTSGRGEDVGKKLLIVFVPSCPITVLIYLVYRRYRPKDV
ncbi:hypothetical protein MKZ38_002664 [Zalerion maritima]|uniref:Uncharacterized protein n=1 Tax=Zalerion maritima TaxID=339359 RepID=A0AAD5RNP6_9PEZI|nr:hypothetical protein MKZ38_002664 [Zalerion maritima]